jgi:hypothetical protein
MKSASFDGKPWRMRFQVMSSCGIFRCAVGKRHPIEDVGLDEFINPRIVNGGIQLRLRNQRQCLAAGLTHGR